MVQTFHEIRQNLWFQGFPLSMINSAGVRTAIEAGVASGLVFNTSAFEWAIKNSRTYDASIRRKLEEGFIGEDLFMELAVEDARKATDLLRFIYDETGGADGWVSLDVSPRTFFNATQLSKAVTELYGRVRRPNAMIKVPGTKEGNLAVVEAVSVGVPVNITNLFSTKQLRSAAEAYLKGVEQRIRTGLKPDSGSALSLDIRPWDTERPESGSKDSSTALDAAIFRCAYKHWASLSTSFRWKRAYNEGARPLRLLCKGMAVEPSVMPKALTAETPMVSVTAFTLHENRPSPSNNDAPSFRPKQDEQKESDRVLSRFVKAGVDIDHMAAVFQKDAVSRFVKDWFALMTAIARKSAALIQVGR